MNMSKELQCDVWKGKYEQLYDLCEMAIKVNRFEFFEAWFKSHRIFLEDMRKNTPLEIEPVMCLDIFSEEPKLETCNEY